MEELGFLVHLLYFAYNSSLKIFAILFFFKNYLHCTSLTFLCFYLSSLITLFTFALTAKLSRRLDGNNYNKHHGTSDLDLQCISININRYLPNSVDPSWLAKKITYFIRKYQLLVWYLVPTLKYYRLLNCSIYMFWFFWPLFSPYMPY